MKRFLFVFGYESPEDARLNRAGDDAESSNAVWVSAAAEKEALERGRAFAERFVAEQFRAEGSVAVPSWQAGDFAHWISKEPSAEFSEFALQSFHDA